MTAELRMLTYGFQILAGHVEKPDQVQGDRIFFPSCGAQEGNVADSAGGVTDLQMETLTTWYVCESDSLKLQKMD